jgi:indole-3-glycerol phosphate synthase
MATLLDQILADSAASVQRRKQTADLAHLEQRAAAHVPRGFAATLRAVAASGPAVIAECKKASPSKGLLCADYHPADIARHYASAGAAAISVLTDEKYFQGSLDDLTAVSDAVKIPVLRKDFMVDPFQMLEARAAGADAVLLIVAAHPDRTLHELNASASALNLDVLCEVHNREELTRAVDLGFETIGVNCRNLKTMEMNPDAHEELVRFLPAKALRVAESGLRTSGDLARLRAAGYDAFLIGETLMRAPQAAAAFGLLARRELTAGTRTS